MVPQLQSGRQCRDTKHRRRRRIARSVDCELRPHRRVLGGVREHLPRGAGARLRAGAGHVAASAPSHCSAAWSTNPFPQIAALRGLGRSPRRCASAFDSRASTGAGGTGRRGDCGERCCGHPRGCGRREIERGCSRPPRPRARHGRRCMRPQWLSPASSASFHACFGASAATRFGAAGRPDATLPTASSPRSGAFQPGRGVSRHRTGRSRSPSRSPRAPIGQDHLVARARLASNGPRSW